MDKIKPIFAKNLKELRLKKKLTQEQLAYKSAVSYKQIQILESEKNPIIPTLTTIVKIARTLKVKPAELLKNL